MCICIYIYIYVCVSTYTCVCIFNAPVRELLGWPSARCLLEPALKYNKEHMLSAVRCTSHALHLQGAVTLARAKPAIGNMGCARTTNANQPQLLLSTHHHQHIIINIAFNWTHITLAQEPTSSVVVKERGLHHNRATNPRGASHPPLRTLHGARSSGPRSLGLKTILMNTVPHCMSCKPSLQQLRPFGKTAVRGRTPLGTEPRQR